MSGPRENVIQARVRLELGADPDLVLWRNGVGFAEHYDEATHETRRQRFGLARGSSDLVGLVRIAPPIRTPVGRFLALELKTERGRESPAQKQWASLVRSMGGVAEVVRSVEEARDVVARVKRGEL